LGENGREKLTGETQCIKTRADPTLNPDLDNLSKGIEICFDGRLWVGKMSAGNMSIPMRVRGHVLLPRRPRYQQRRPTNLSAAHHIFIITRGQQPTK